MQRMDSFLGLEDKRGIRRRFVAYASILFVGLGAAGWIRHNGAGEGARPQAGPLIDVWYGSEQWFGQLGNPQEWVNILGNVSSPIGVASLRYSLNGGKRKRLSIGPDMRRLASAGDFNAEVDIDDLADGLNVVKIEAVDISGVKSVKAVSVHYARGRTWPMPYTVHWSAAPTIQETAQVVDGLWNVEREGIRPTKLWYDRALAIGDVFWTDYEVTVPVTIHRFDPAAYNPISTGPMVGIALRWKGHYYASDGSQSYIGSWPIGALCVYAWIVHSHKADFRLELQGLKTIATDNSGRQLALGVRYIFKARAETRPHQTSFYRFKVWQEGTPEPSGWDLSGPGAVQGNDQGSVLLVAHHSDVTFGDVTIVPVAVNSGHVQRASSLLASPNPSKWESR
jgi:hypothetical protein